MFAVTGAHDGREERCSVRRRVLPIVALILIASCDSDRSSFGNAARGRELVERYRCQACHNVPGVTPVAGTTAPSLARFARRKLIARKTPNTPANLIAYLQNPRGADPANTMPDLEIPPEDARDLAAFLTTLR